MKQPVIIWCSLSLDPLTRSPLFTVALVPAVEYVAIIVTPTITSVAEHQSERQRIPRIPFKATSVVREAGSSQIVVAQTTELSRLGCFVQTATPYPKGTRVHIEVAEAGTRFVASGAVAYVTVEGMGVVFSLVEPDNQAILENWLSRTPKRPDRYSFTAKAAIKDLSSQIEQVLMTRDLSEGGTR